MAENLTQVNSYQDKLLEAMSIVSSQLISSIPYDKTITCTIIDDSKKSTGEYRVTTGDATFEAYSSDTSLKKDDVVYVTIPEGNYDNQKIIQGKKTSQNEKPFVFITPFDTMLDLTNDLIANESVDGFTHNTKSSLIANNGYITKEVQIEVDGEQVTKEIIKEEKVQTKRICHLDLRELNLTGYSRLGLKANFMSWLPTAQKGSYGLKITIIDNLKTTTLDDHSVDEVQQTKIMLLDASDMYGNPYNFENYYSQEKVFPITELNTITDIIIDFYQIAGSFYDNKNEILTLQDAIENTETEGQISYTTNFGDNLFVDNIQVSLGYDVSEITGEYIVPVINDSMTYSEYRESEKNKKEIDLRWVHQFESGPRVVKPNEDFDPEKETAQLKDCQIKWYRYKLGAAAADEYCGVYWTGLKVTQEGSDYILSDWDGSTKSVDDVDNEGNPIKKEVPDYGDEQALENIIFSPDTSYQTEQIKAIIYLNGVAIRGPVITFRNEQSTAGKDVENFLNALEIQCVDDTLGNYLLYNEAGNILNTADAQQDRKLKCNFAETGAIAKSNLLLDYEKGDEISWKFPLKNSMISLQGYKNVDGEQRYYVPYPTNDLNGKDIDYPNSVPDYYIVGTTEDSPVYIADSYLIIQGEAAFCSINNSILYPSYKIGAMYSMYNMNNTIACTVRKDRVIYTTEKEFTFGVAGTMGSDKSLVIDFVGGQTAIIANDTETSYQLEVKMYDENNKPEDLSNVKIKWSWYTPGNETVYTNLDFKTNNAPIVELKNKGLNLISKQQIYIAKVVVGDDGAELETYFPIPIKREEEYSHIEGATSVIYLSNGEPEYYKGDYKLYITEDNQIGSPSTQICDVTEVEWKVISQDTSDFVAEVNFDGTQGLRPFNVYTEGVSNYAVVAYHNGRAVWQQPILVIRNKYPSRVINKWDGKTLTMDEENGTILATAMAVGRKEDDNTFTGVMLGDWTQETVDDSLSKATGIYGFHQGAMCYALMDNGTAFLGKNSVGRINLDGNEATIKSSNYQEPNGQDFGSGMCIDFNGGTVITADPDDPDNFITSNNSPFIKMYGDGGKIILDTKSTATGYPFEIGDKFKSRWDGHIIANSGLIGGWQLEEVIREDQVDEVNNITRPNVPVKGGRFIADVQDPKDYWGKIELDPLTNTISGGKLKASIFESRNNQPIKLGGALAVYDPGQLTKVHNPHNNTDEDQVNYAIAPSGTSSEELSQYGRLGGTLGFMGAKTGGEIDADFENAGIGMKAEGGAELKVTNRNVGMNIGSNYLFLTDYSTKIEGEEELRHSEFVVKTTGTSSIPIYNEVSGKFEGVQTDIATTTLRVDGKGMSVITGGDSNLGARIILQVDEWTTAHVGMGYGKSYIALYGEKALLAGAYSLELKAAENMIISSGGTNVKMGTDKAINQIEIGRLNYAAYPASLDEQKYGTDTIINGGNFNINATTNLTHPNYRNNNYIGQESDSSGLGNAIFNIKYGSAKIDGYLIIGELNNNTLWPMDGTKEVPALQVKGITELSKQLRIANGGAAITGDTTISGNTTISGSLTNNNQGYTLTWLGNVTFRPGATQTGIRAQFA